MCRHVSIWLLKSCLSVPREKKNHPSFVNISLTLVIDTSMERSSRVLQHGNPKIWFSFKKRLKINYCNGGGILFSSSPINFHLFKACHISFERSLRVHSEIILSVCTTIFKRIAGLRFYHKYFMLTSIWVYESVRDRSLSLVTSPKFTGSRFQDPKGYLGECGDHSLPVETQLPVFLLL